MIYELQKIFPTNRAYLYYVCDIQIINEVEVEVEVPAVSGK